jgi:hypothetical protein
MNTKQSAIEAAELAWAEHERNGFCMSKDGKRRLRAAILAYLSAIAEDRQAVVDISRQLGFIDWEHRRDTVEIVLRTLLERAKEQQG